VHLRARAQERESPDLHKNRVGGKPRAVFGGNGTGEVTHLARAHAGAGAGCSESSPWMVTIGRHLGADAAREVLGCWLFFLCGRFAIRRREPEVLRQRASLVAMPRARSNTPTDAARYQIAKKSRSLGPRGSYGARRVETPLFKKTPCSPPKCRPRKLNTSCGIVYYYMIIRKKSYSNL
jgi:hypothetical protein